MIATAPETGRVQPEPAAGRLPSLARQAAVRGLVELKLFFRQREAVVFTFALPIILLLLFGEIFHGEIGHTGVTFRQYFIAGITASGLLRVCQEALSNVRKHAKARAVRVQLRYRRDGVSLEIADDGVGFDPALAGEGFGLRGMRTRVAEIGGGLTNAAIGRALFVSEATVKTHLTRACIKLGVVGRTAAVTKAMEVGALPPPGQPG